MSHPRSVGRSTKKPWRRTSSRPSTTPANTDDVSARPRRHRCRREGLWQQPAFRTRFAHFTEPRRGTRRTTDSATSSGVIPEHSTSPPSCRSRVADGRVLPYKAVT
jgi:hypothetical protein